MTAEEVWRNGVTPVVYRPPHQRPLLVRLPAVCVGSHEARFSWRRWLRRGRRSHPAWLEQFKCYELPRSSFTDIAKRLAHEFGSVYIIQAVRGREICAPACLNARGLECECSCLGRNHGAGEDGGRWYVISETCAVRWHDSELRWSLLRWGGKRSPESKGPGHILPPPFSYW